MTAGARSGPPPAAYQVVVCKRPTFAVRAASPDEARALALVMADGAGSRLAQAAVRCLGRTLAVEACEEAAVGLQAPQGGPA